MARPTQNTIDYFSHDCNHKQTMYILENKYKNDGYAFWFKLLESLGSAPNHFLDLNDEIACEFLAAKTNINWSSCDEILTLLAKINAICPELWSKKIVWCQKFVDRMAGVYAKRKKELPVKPSFCYGNDSIVGVSVVETPQSKLNESRVNKIKDNAADFKKPAGNDLPFSEESEKTDLIIEKSSKSTYSSDFESFWSEYPAKVAKGAAAKSFKKALKKATFDKIMSGLKTYCQTKKVITGVICNPTTWLNQERWNDTYPESEMNKHEPPKYDEAAIYEMEEKIHKGESVDD